MLRVGEFSRFSQVTVATLRHYDALGLLTPAHTDPATSYRYYTVEQLAGLHRIMALKELGLALDQIAALVAGDLPAEQLRGMLVLREAEARQRAAEATAQHQRIRFHLRQLERAADLAQLEVRRKPLAPFRALVSRHRFATHAAIEPVAGEVLAALRAHGVRLAAPISYFIYGDEYRPADVDAAFVVPVDAGHTADVPLATAGTLAVAEAPAVPEAATYLYRGSPDDVNHALVDLQRWVAANGYRLGGVIRLVHLRGPLERLPLGDWLTEVQHPLEPA